MSLRSSEELSSCAGRDLFATLPTASASYHFLEISRAFAARVSTRIRNPIFAGEGLEQA
jgi:hypothetical protein